MQGRNWMELMFTPDGKVKATFRRTSIWRKQRGWRCRKYHNGETESLYNVWSNTIASYCFYCTRKVGKDRQFRSGSHLVEVQ